MAINSWITCRARRMLAAASLALGLSAAPASAGLLPATVPEPLGATVNGVFKVQANLAYADHFVIYEMEWKGLTAELSPYGRFHILEMARRWGTTPAPIVIEVNLDDKVNEQRRMTVVNALAKTGVPDPERRVVVGFSRAEGLFGDEAMFLYPQFLLIRFRMMRMGMMGMGGMGMGGMGMFGMGGMGMFGGMGGMGMFGGLGGFGGGFGGFGGFGGGGGGGSSGYRGLGY